MFSWFKKKPIKVELNLTRLLDLSGLDEHEDRIIDIIKTYGPLGRKSIYWKMFDLHSKEYKFYRGSMNPLCDELDEVFARLQNKQIIKYDKFREIYYCENMSSHKVDDYSFMNALMKKHQGTFYKCKILDELT